MFRPLRAILMRNIQLVTTTDPLYACNFDLIFGDVFAVVGLYVVVLSTYYQLRISMDKRNRMQH
jgi:hypothetical protein